jgi:hypothetical protein
MLLSNASRFSELWPSHPASGCDQASSHASANDTDMRTVIERFVDNNVLSVSLNFFVVAWLFGNQKQVCPGLLFGYEKLEINAESYNSRVSIEGVYITPAVQDGVFMTAKNPFDDDTPNCASLPRIELLARYYASKSDGEGQDAKTDAAKSRPSFSVSLRGDSFRLTLVPSVVPIISSFVF